MANLGDSTTPTSGTWSDARTGGNAWWITNSFTMPAGGGIVTNMNWYGAATSGTTFVTLVIWNASTGAVIWSGASGSFGTAQGWVGKAVPNVYIAGGTAVALGIWVGGTADLTWEVETAGENGGVRFQSMASLGSKGAGTDEYGGAGFGCFGAYITYTPGGVAHINTGTPGAPNWVIGVVSVNTGTPAAPVWTPARVQVNTGTPAAPVWTDAV